MTTGGLGGGVCLYGMMHNKRSIRWQVLSGTLKPLADLLRVAVTFPNMVHLLCDPRALDLVCSRPRLHPTPKAQRRAHLFHMHKTHLGAIRWFSPMHA